MQDAETTVEQAVEQPGEKSSSTSSWSSDQDDSIDEILDLSRLSPYSPSNSPEARRKREETPIFGHLPGHGITTYGFVPEDRSVEIDDTSPWAIKAALRSGSEYRVIEGSTNGFYLQHWGDFQMLARIIAATDWQERPSRRGVLKLIESIHKLRNTWPNECTRLQLAMGNRSSWLNETWGPPIKNEDGRIVGSSPFTPEREIAHPSHLGLLTRQYRGNKRENDRSLLGQPIEREVKARKTHTDSLLTQPMEKEKPLRKTHKRYTSPASPEIESAIARFQDGSGAVADDSASLGQKEKLVLYPPKPKQPSDGVCARCGAEVEERKRWACQKCFRLVYCSLDCQFKRTKTFCSLICQEVNNPWAAVVESLSEQFASTGPSDANSADSDTPVVESTEKNMDESESAELDDGLGVTASEIAKQIKAMQEFERLKVQKDLLEQVENHRIVEYRIVHKGRTLQYQIEHTSTGSKSWRDATDMQGLDWSLRMLEFWYQDEKRITTRRFLENPEGDNQLKPSPFGKYVMSAQFEQHRVIIFQVNKGDFNDHASESDTPSHGHDQDDEHDKDNQDGFESHDLDAA